jgi:RNA polymerase sigma-70 factor (ECF subfamily)
VDDSRTDETLMLAWRDGEEAAFEALYARHRARLFRYLLHQCRQREQADEMFQEIWMSVIRARSGYEVSAKFTTWLYRIAHNRLIDGFRARGRLAEFEVDAADAEGDPPDYPAPAGGQPERLLERAQLAGRLLAAIEALPGPQREAFLLATEGGLTVEEIGNATGAGFETAKSRLRYAYARLRGELGDLR